MPKIYTLALLFYNVIAVISISRKYELYDESSENKLEELLELLKDSDMKHRQLRTETGTEPPELEHWTGRWFPEQPGDPTPPPKIYPSKKPGSHRMDMGPIVNCDDGKTRLEVDWDNSPDNYTCFDDIIQRDFYNQPIIYSVEVPLVYRAIHKCMNETIEYDDNIPTFGTHRPVYPVYGEYKFLPRQRWLHSLEHGAVVMLYHPCAHPEDVVLLKKLVKKCLRRHIITPYNLLSKEQPFALVTWGTRFTMSFVSPGAVIDFIIKNALQGPERLPHNGDFDEGLIIKAETVSDFIDSVLCPIG